MTLPAWLKRLLPILVIVLVVAAISEPIYAYRILNPTVDDFKLHVLFTQRLLKHDLPPTFVLAHPLLQLITGFIYWAGRGHIGLWETAVLVQVCIQVTAALVLYALIGPIRRRGGELLRVFLSISLTLVAPLMLLAPLDGKYYFGYIGLASYHNPTVLLLRPFALLSFVFGLRALRQPRSPAWMVALAAATMFVGMLAKPNYAIAFLPALGLLALWFLWKKRPLDWPMLILGQALPFLAAMVFQAVLIYLLPDSDGAGITIAPFAVESYWSGYIPLKFLLSIAFPLAALAATWRSARQNDELILAWLSFGVAVVQLYLLAETGDRFTHGNFRWGSQVTLFVLFLVSVRALIRDELAQSMPWRERLWKRWPVYALYLAHLAAGAAYYIYALTTEIYA